MKPDVKGEGEKFPSDAYGEMAALADQVKLPFVAERDRRKAINEYLRN